MENIKIHKFGGGLSLNVQIFLCHLVGLLKICKPNILVLSAFGKTTNALEDLVNGHIAGDKNKMRDALCRVETYNLPAVDLFKDGKEKAGKVVNKHMEFLERFSKDSRSFKKVEDMIMDAILPIGEIMASEIIALYLNENGFRTNLVRADNFIKTDMNFRKANVLKFESGALLQTSDLIQSVLKGVPVVTQGFIGSTYEEEYFTFGGLTTLGREGSDYTAALLANMLVNASISVEEVVLWKDVDAVANRNPKEKSSELLKFFDFLSYEDAKRGTQENGFAEDLIHEKTISEVEGVSVPLWVKNFYHPELHGTFIGDRPSYCF